MKPYKVPAATVAKMPQQKRTRLLCTIDGKVGYRCGLNHMGDGDFFIIVSTKNLNAIGKKEGDIISFVLTIDENPLGVEMPEVLEALLTQDEDAMSAYNKLTDGKKRSLMYYIIRFKDVDKQVKAATDFLSGRVVPGRKS
jgi:hypothetical protein